MGERVCCGWVGLGYGLGKAIAGEELGWGGLWLLRVMVWEDSGWGGMLFEEDCGIGWRKRDDEPGPHSV